MLLSALSNLISQCPDHTPPPDESIGQLLEFFTNSFFELSETMAWTLFLDCLWNFLRKCEVRLPDDIICIFIRHIAQGSCCEQNSRACAMNLGLLSLIHYFQPLSFYKNFPRQFYLPIIEVNLLKFQDVKTVEMCFDLLIRLTAPNLFHGDDLVHLVFEYTPFHQICMRSRAFTDKGLAKFGDFCNKVMHLMVKDCDFVSQFAETGVLVRLCELLVDSETFLVVDSVGSAFISNYGNFGKEGLKLILCNRFLDGFARYCLSLDWMESDAVRMMREILDFVSGSEGELKRRLYEEIVRLELIEMFRKQANEVQDEYDNEDYDVTFELWDHLNAFFRMR
jgi:hypothetical protein